MARVQGTLIVCGPEVDIGRLDPRLVNSRGGDHAAISTKDSRSAHLSLWAVSLYTAGGRDDCGEQGNQRDRQDGREG